MVEEDLSAEPEGEEILTAEPVVDLTSGGSVQEMIWMDHRVE